MRKTILFIGISLDGFIADKNGGVDWLVGNGEAGVVDSRYEEFLANIDTVILGNTTYQQVVHELSPGVWPYSGMKSYVLSNKPQQAKEDTIFLKEDVNTLVQNLKKEEGKDIWIVGGAGLIQPLLQSNAIDEYNISVIPTILGDGIKLFQDTFQPIQLEFISQDEVDGIVSLIYKKK
ncbi:dihydrofolate reductase family protein [Metaclostridioides mangenotii]|uniref:dihydrofolate reductase family protein n=1 Tax=Metaclostridioides mangenotii TaxID=1540 RepID=UPI00048101E7|nr:dihydrofolate reductase family protein [Clostridioides mangenotii]